MRVVVAVVALFALAFAYPNPSLEHVVLGRVPDCVNEGNCASHDWSVARDLVETEMNVKLVFALKQKNADSCDSLLMEVSHPDSASFGRQYSFEEIGTIFGNPTAAKTVVSYLKSHNIPSEDITVNPNNDFVSVTVPHSVAERLLATKFFKFSSEASKKNIIRAYEYSVPAFLADHVDFVGNVISFPRTTNVKPMFTPNADSLTTPDLINKIYNVGSNQCVSGQSTQSLFESLGQSYSEDDLASFQSQYNIPREKVTTVIGPNTPDSCSSDPNNCAEANLDVQYMLAVARNASTTFWSVPGDSEPFLEWIQAVSAASNPPLVHSMSYGSIESENDASEMTRFNLEACKLGLRRISVMISSGDDGVANYGARGDSSQCGFNPSYPASCPYVTAVGATQGPEDGKDEVACQSDKGGLITTGGGFSGVFTQPSYQSDAVKNYLSTASNLPPTSKFASGGRGYPDVSAMGHNYPVYIGGQSYPVSGTSASSPVFAALVTLVNDARLAAGKTAIGFLNPILYSSKLASVYNDITSGDNKCCAGGEGSPVCCKYGFYCAAGWDPVTGLGTPNFSALKQALVAM